jgi:sugar lactone lactonase YvrE
MKKILLSFIAFAFATSSMLAQPVIIQQPVNQNVIWASNATFSVMTTGVWPLTYQWQMNGTNLPNGIITTVAGNGITSSIGDGGSALIASLNAPSSLALDSAGNIFIADTGNDCVRKLGTNGIITRFAGSGAVGFSGDGDNATKASLNYPFGLAVDPIGNVFIADLKNNRIRKVDTNGIISTVSGGLAFPTGIVLDGVGNLFIADQSHHLIRKMDTNDILTTVAGNGNSGYAGDGGAATNANLSFPTGVAVDAVGELFIADYNNNVIRKVDTNGLISTFAGNGTGLLYSGGVATNVMLSSPANVWADASGNLFFPNRYSNLINKVDTSGIITIVAGNGGGGFHGDGGFATNAAIYLPEGAVTDAGGNLFIADTVNNRIRKVDTNGIITTIAGTGFTNYLGDGTAAISSPLNLPVGVAPDTLGNFFVVDKNLQRIRRVDVNGIITTIAGTGTSGFNGDNRPAITAQLNNPASMAIDSVGNLFIADQSNHRIRKVGTNGFIQTVAGNGTASFFGDGSAATNANLNSPAGIAVDIAGNLFIADTSNQRIRKVDAFGIITTIAGTNATGYSGDGGLAITNRLNNPTGVAVDAVGNLFIADTSNQRIRKVSTNGIITTVAGTNGIGSFSGDGGLAVTNHLNNPTGVAVDSIGTLFIADQNNDRIRRVGTNGIITTITGNGSSTYSGDGGLAANATVCLPIGVAVDVAGNLYIADEHNLRIRKVVYADKPFLTLINNNTNNVGNYSVIITSASGSVTSSVVSLNLQLPPIVPTFTAIDGIYNFTWSAVSNVTYQLQCTTNLAMPIWQNLGSPITATNGTVSASDISGTDAQRFYRVQLVQ